MADFRGELNSYKKAPPKPEGQDLVNQGAAYSIFTRILPAVSMA